MRLPVLILIMLILIGIGTDTYIWFAIRRLTARRWVRRVHIGISVILLLMLLSVFFMPVRSGSDTMLRCVMWILYTYLAFYVPKLLFVIFDAISLIPRLWKKIQLLWLSYTGCGLAVIVFGMMWWGALINRYRIDVMEVEIPIPNLPAQFDGFSIAQISDLHVGSYGTDTTFLHDLVERVNALKPDMIVFTGDIVNRLTDETTPFVNILSRLHAPYGVYSILGNHDYGDYVDWKNPADKKTNFERLLKVQDQMGWHMLNNDHDFIVNRGDTLVLIGVENVGDPPFQTYGDLGKAYPDISDSRTKILLSHNPAHWENDIQAHPEANIALTLSGHTHAMQIEVFGLSPAAWRYRAWGGLYDDDMGHMLYVNIGAGTVAMPARIGATPEITLLTLRPAASKQR